MADDQGHKELEILFSVNDKIRSKLGHWKSVLEHFILLTTNTCRGIQIVFA